MKKKGKIYECLSALKVCSFGQDFMQFGSRKNGNNHCEKKIIGLEMILSGLCRTKPRSFNNGIKFE